jgi:hypothetical protein
MPLAPPVTMVARPLTSNNSLVFMVLLLAQ